MLFRHQTPKYLKVDWTNTDWKEYEEKYNFTSTYSPTVDRGLEHAETNVEGAVEELAI